MITPTEAKKRETDIRNAVEHLNDLIRTSHVKGVHTQLYVNETAYLELTEGRITRCDIWVVPSGIEMEGEFE